MQISKEVLEALEENGYISVKSVFASVLVHTLLSVTCF